jgi:spore coat polysaccharide biosynthesis protein SpsF
MSTTLGIVEVPASTLESTSRETSSGFLPARRFGNKSLLEWVVRRVTDSLLLERVAIVAEEGQGGVIERLAPPDVPVFVGRQPDSLGRIAAAVEHFQADHLVRVPLCCPFIDPEMIDRLVCTAAANASCDYVGYFSLDGRPAVLSKVGLFAEWCSSEAVARANRIARLDTERSNCMQFVFSHADLFQLRFIPVPERLERGDVRLMLEGKDDWEVADMIVEALGPDELDWRRIVGFLEQQPALRRRLGVPALQPNG